MRHLVELVMYCEREHFHMFAQSTHEAPIGQQPVWPRTLCAPQQTPGCVWEKAREQSFLKQQLLQPSDARLRRSL